MKTVIIGASNSALEIYDILVEKNYPYHIYFYDENPKREGEIYGPSRVIDIRKETEKVIAFLGIGQPCKAFIQRVDKYTDRWIQLTHPDAQRGSYMDIGKGCIIQRRVTAMTHSSLGDFVYLNVGCLIGHHAKIGSYSCIAPQALILGHVQIGEECYIGANSTIREDLKVADRVVVGAGAVVIKDITEADTVWAGVPAKMIKRR